jgi:hypothetical protein
MLCGYAASLFKKSVAMRHNCLSSVFRPLSSAVERSVTNATRLRHGASTACTHTVSGSISLRSPRFFSPFPHGTGSLSVSKEYLALEDGPPLFSQRFTCADLLVFTTTGFRVRGYHPVSPDFPDCSTNTLVT